MSDQAVPALKSSAQNTKDCKTSEDGLKPSAPFLARPEEILGDPTLSRDGSARSLRHGYQMHVLFQMHRAGVSSTTAPSWTSTISTRPFARWTTLTWASREAS
jgi:hypothetical protein